MLQQPEVFLEDGQRGESHSLKNDPNDHDLLTFDLPFDFPNSVSGFSFCDTQLSGSEADSCEVASTKSCSDDTALSVSSGDSFTPNIAIPFSFADCSTSSGCYDNAPVHNCSIPVDSTAFNLKELINYSNEEKRRLAEKQRRLRRIMILKQKRALGLISVNNCRKVRYQQKQVTAMQKTRINGKFSCNELFLAVLLNKHSISLWLIYPLSL